MSPIIVPDDLATSTFGETLTEFYARGFDYLNQDTAGQTRAKRWVNRAYLQLCEAFPWPFVEDEVEDTAPLTLGDMRAVLSVVDSTNGAKLSYVETRSLTDFTTDTDLAGTPCHYWLDGNTVNLYPTSTTVEVKVRYLTVPDELEDDTDVLVVPNRFTDLVVDGAVLRAYKDTDNFNAHNALKASYQDDLMGMAASLMVRNHSGPDLIVSAGGHADA